MFHERAKGTNPLALASLVMVASPFWLSPLIPSGHFGEVLLPRISHVTPPGSFTAICDFSPRIARHCGGVVKVLVVGCGNTLTHRHTHTRHTLQLVSKHWMNICFEKFRGHECVRYGARPGAVLQEGQDSVPTTATEGLFPLKNEHERKL